MLYHGGCPYLVVDDYLLPASVTGADIGMHPVVVNGIDLTEWVWLTSSLNRACGYALAWMANDSGHRSGAVYRAEPVGIADIGIGTDVVCTKARITAVVTPARVTATAAAFRVMCAGGHRCPCRSRLQFQK